MDTSPAPDSVSLPPLAEGVKSVKDILESFRRELMGDVIGAI